MSMNPTGDETHMTLDEMAAVFAIDYPERDWHAELSDVLGFAPEPAPLTSTLVIVHTVMGDFVFEVTGVDFPEAGDPTPW